MIKQKKPNKPKLPKGGRFWGHKEGVKIEELM